VNNPETCIARAIDGTAQEIASRYDDVLGLKSSVGLLRDKIVLVDFFQKRIESNSVSRQFGFEFKVLVGIVANGGLGV
jgi:hypothetical protein